MIIAADLDGMLFAFPEFFQNLFFSLQAQGGKAGIITAREESQKEVLLEALAKLKIAPDFFVAMPKELLELDYSHGLFKAMVCNDLKVNILFDDFQYDNPSMIADFFSLNQNTIPFTSWAYNPFQLI